MTSFESDRFLHMVPSRGPLATAAAGTLAVLTLLVTIVLGPVSAVSVSPYVLAALYFWLRSQRKSVTGRLGVNPDGVLWEGRLVAPRREIQAGFVVPGAGVAVTSGPAGGPPPELYEVRLVRRFPRRPLRFLTPDEATARTLLRELGLDASQTTVTLPFGSRMRASSAAAVLWTLSLLGMPVVLVVALIAGLFAGALPAALAVIPCLVWTALNLAGTAVHIGADGLLIKWLWTSRFVPYESLMGVDRYVGGAGAGVTLRLRGGEEIRLPRMGAFTMAIDLREIDLVTHRVRHAVQHQRQAHVDRGLALPKRGERSAAEWIAALRAVGSGAGSDHRTAPVGADRLLRIAEDPGAVPATRAAAAVALGGGADEASRARLRFAAESTVEPDLRAALALAAEEEASAEDLAAAIGRLRAS